MTTIPARKLILLIGSLVLVLCLLSVTIAYLAPAKKTIDLAAEAIKSKNSEIRSTVKESPKDSKTDSAKIDKRAKTDDAKTYKPAKTDNAKTDETNTGELKADEAKTETDELKTDKTTNDIKANDSSLNSDAIPTNSSNPSPSSTPKSTPAQVVNIVAPTSENPKSSTLNPKKYRAGDAVALKQSDGPPSKSDDETLVVPPVEVLPILNRENKESENVKPAENLASAQNLKIGEILIIPCGIKNKFVCSSFVIAGFLDGHKVQIFTVNKDDIEIENIIKKVSNIIENQSDFDASKVIANLSETVEIDGVKIQHTSLDENMTKEIKGKTLKSISAKIGENDEFSIVLSGSEEKIKSFGFELGMNLNFRIKGTLLPLFEGRYFGSIEISGFDKDLEDSDKDKDKDKGKGKGKVIKIFMSVIENEKSKYDEILGALHEIDCDNFEDEFPKILPKMGEMKANQEDGIEFKHTLLVSKFSMPKQPKLEEFGKEGFTKFFRDLRNVNSWSMKSLDFFVILIGESRKLELFQLGMNKKKIE